MFDVPCHAVTNYGTKRLPRRRSLLAMTWAVESFLLVFKHLVWYRRLNSGSYVYTYLSLRGAQRRGNLAWPRRLNNSYKDSTRISLNPFVIPAEAGISASTIQTHVGTECVAHLVERAHFPRQSPGVCIPTQSMGRSTLPVGRMVKGGVLTVHRDTVRETPNQDGNEKSGGHYHV